MTLGLSALNESVWWHSGTGVQHVSQSEVILAQVPNRVSEGINHGFETQDTHR